MADNTTTIHVKVRSDIKAKAQKNAKLMGIPLSALVNAFLIKIAADGRVPFELSVPEVPNAKTISAMREINEGKGKRYEDTAAMLEDLGIDN